MTGSHGRDTPGSQQAVPTRPLTDHHGCPLTYAGRSPSRSWLVTTVINHVAVALSTEPVPVRGAWLQGPEDPSSDPSSVVSSRCDLGQTA